MHYEMTIAGLKRKLQLYPVNDNLSIAAFILFGDVEITEAAAKELVDRAPAFDVILTAEAKSIPLAYEMSRLSGCPYVIARKGIKIYMENVVTVTVNSITTRNLQELHLGQREVDMLKGRKVLIVDDVISTGASLASLVELAEKAGGNIVGKMAVLAEGDAMDRPDITALERLPLFNGDGTVKE